MKRCMSCGMPLLKAERSRAPLFQNTYCNAYFSGVEETFCLKKQVKNKQTLSNREGAKLCLAVFRQFGAWKRGFVVVGCNDGPVQSGIKSSIICLAEFSQAVQTHPVPLCSFNQGELVFVPKILLCVFQVWRC